MIKFPSTLEEFCGNLVSQIVKLYLKMIENLLLLFSLKIVTLQKIKKWTTTNNEWITKLFLFFVGVWFCRFLGTKYSYLKVTIHGRNCFLVSEVTLFVLKNENLTF